MAKPGKQSMFEQTTVDRKQITVKICPEVFAAIEALEQRLTSMGGKLAFNRTKVIEQALREAIDAGNAELDSREQA